MVGAINHRGPDESGLYIDDHCGLGHARLSIIDLSGGSQPIHNEDQSLWIIFNGEIFNYLELREELLAKGHRFYTSSDTEVILHIFEELGPDCLKRLNGQFALAIWDSSRKELFLARDRVGIRPIFFTLQNDRLVFASEIKSLFSSGDIPRRFDPVALDEVFTFWTTLPGRSVFQGVQEVPPGHYLVASNGRTTLRKFWELPFFPPEEHLDWPFGKIRDEIAGLLLDSTRIRLRADVPVGCYLSGGLDSSGITTMVRRNFNNNLRTFGIGFAEKDFDESTYQELMVSHLGTEHTRLRADNTLIGARFPDVIWHCEKPLLRTAPVPLFLLSDVVRRNGFKVVLTGEGADEIFGGYNIFRETLIRRFWAKDPKSRFRPLLMKELYPYIFKDSRAKQSLSSFFAKGLEDPDDPFFSHRIRWEDTSRAKMFFSEDLRSEVGAYDALGALRDTLPSVFGKWDPLSRAQYLETAIFLSNYLLSSQGDRVAMAHSVEIRLPFLDFRVVEFMGRVPTKWKIWGMNEKFLLKKVFDALLPDTILKRPKHPYRAPIHQSLLKGDNPVLRDALSDGTLRKFGLFDPKRIERLLSKVHKIGQVSEVEGMALAGIASTHILAEQFLTGFPYRQILSAVPTVVYDKRSVDGK
jgi:asparagine synthase (glutamine-hydrolysing)